jgi:hypothetical protein
VIRIRRSLPPFIAGLFVMAATLGLTTGCGKNENVDPSDRDRAVDKAQAVYAQSTASGVALSQGPCIAEELPGLPDWVVDIAHDPRQPVDDDPANQCQRYRSGEAHHFVELDPDGTLIKAE